MRSLILCVVLLGCGSVKSNDPHDAPAVAIDMPAQGCTVHDTIASCGATCQMCAVTGARQMPTCNGTMCGAACLGNAPTCSDTSCSQLLFDFSTGLQGAVATAPVKQPYGVRAFQGTGSQALALDVIGLTEITFHVPVCLTGVLNLSTRTLKGKFYFEGGNDAGDQYYIQGSVPTPTTGNYLATQPAAHNVIVNYAAPMSASAASAMANDVTFRVGTFGAAFTGTIWVDDITIE